MHVDIIDNPPAVVPRKARKSIPYTQIRINAAVQVVLNVTIRGAGYTVTSHTTLPETMYISDRMTVTFRVFNDTFPLILSNESEAENITLLSHAALSSSTTTIGKPFSCPASRTFPGHRY
jgi:hypothetical protein